MKVVIEGKSCRGRQKLLGIEDSLVHLLGTYPVIVLLQQRVKRLCQLGDGAGEVGLLLGDS